MKEFIYDLALFAEAHASTVVELRNGDLMSAWFGGSEEGAHDVAIWGSTRRDGGWSGRRYRTSRAVHKLPLGRSPPLPRRATTALAPGGAARKLQVSPRNIAPIRRYG